MIEHTVEVEVGQYINHWLDGGLDRSDNLQLCLIRNKVGYYCTRERLHDGPHVAHNTRGESEVSASWYDVPTYMLVDEGL